MTYWIRERQTEMNLQRSSESQVGDGEWRKSILLSDDQKTIGGDESRLTTADVDVVSTKLEPD